MTTTTEETTMADDRSRFPNYATDPDPMPAHPLPSDLAVLPIEEMAHSYAVYAHLALTASAADGGRLALDALAHGTAVLAQISRQLDPLIRAAHLAGASAQEVAARVPADALAVSA